MDEKIDALHHTTIHAVYDGHMQRKSRSVFIGIMFIAIHVHIKLSYIKKSPCKHNIFQNDQVQVSIIKDYHKLNYKHSADNSYVVKITKFCCFGGMNISVN